MRKSAIILARVLAFIELFDLLSGSKTSTSEVVTRLVERYGFQKFPKTIEELDPGKGIEFLAGSTGEFPIKKFVIWDTLLTLETNISTDVSKGIIEEILEWASKELDIKYKPGAIKRFGYISDVTFFSDAQILDVNPSVRSLAVKCSEELSRIWLEPVKYEPFTVRIGHDPTSRKYPIAPFLIEHRAETRFSEDKYFSEAPLPTDLHWKLLEEFELNMQLNRKAGNV